MGLQVSEVDLRALLQVVSPASAEASSEALPVSVLSRAHDLIGCDVVSYNDFDPRARVDFDAQEYPKVGGENVDAFWQHYWGQSACSYSSRTGDERSVVMVSDFYTQRQLHDSPMYVEFSRPLGLEHEIIMCIPTPGDRTRRLHFARGPGADFSERDRLLLSLLRPHVSELLRQRDDDRQITPDLTTRQRQLLSLVAQGHTNDEIARRLFVSPLTVRKHLENIFERLGSGLGLPPSRWRLALPGRQTLRQSSATAFTSIRLLDNQARWHARTSGGSGRSCSSNDRAG